MWWLLPFGLIGYALLSQRRVITQAAPQITQTIVNTAKAIEQSTPVQDVEKVVRNVTSSINTASKNVNAVITSPSATNISTRGLQFIRDRERFSPTAYNDPPSSATWSIGYGHQIHVGDGLSRTSRITQQQAETLLQSDVARFVGAVRTVPISLTQSQFDALVSFAYNIGEAAFRSSTMFQMLSVGDIASAANQFMRWINAGGQVSPSLQTRRQAELAMFNGALV